MKKMSFCENQQIVGGFKWKCKHSYHSNWAGNTFISSFHGLFHTANANMNDHRRTYEHTNTWIS